jgi:hypothetical protein
MSVINRTIKIHFIECGALHADGKSHVRGWAYIKGDDCYVCEDHYDLQLIAHEIGHCLGKRHTILPTTMNPSGVFRWFTNPLRSLLLIVNHWRNRP